MKLRNWNRIFVKPNTDFFTFLAWRQDPEGEMCLLRCSVPREDRAGDASHDGQTEFWCHRRQDPSERERAVAEIVSKTQFSYTLLIVKGCPGRSFIPGNLTVRADTHRIGEKYVRQFLAQIRERGRCEEQHDDVIFEGIEGDHPIDLLRIAVLISFLAGKRSHRYYMGIHHFLPAQHVR